MAFRGFDVIDPRGRHAVDAAGVDQLALWADDAHVRCGELLAKKLTTAWPVRLEHQRLTKFLTSAPARGRVCKSHTPARRCGRVAPARR